MGSLVSPVTPVPLTELGRVHFTGIGGAGMSGIARIMIARGVKVSGSDAAASDLLTALAGQGADVHVGHAAENIDGADTLVVSTAIREDNPELAEARRRGLRTVAFVGYDGGRVADDALADHVVVTRSQHIPRIQEAQASAWHVLRELVELA